MWLLLLRLLSTIVAMVVAVGKRGMAVDLK